MTGSNTYAYPTHANTREYCCATHVCTTQREPCECVSEELVSPVVKIPLCCRDVPLHGVGADIPPQHEEVVRRKV